MPKAEEEGSVVSRVNLLQFLLNLNHFLEACYNPDKYSSMQNALFSSQCIKISQQQRQIIRAQHALLKNSELETPDTISHLKRLTRFFSIVGLGINTYVRTYITVNGRTRQAGLALVSSYSSFDGKHTSKIKGKDYHCQYFHKKLGLADFLYLDQIVYDYIIAIKASSFVFLFFQKSGAENSFGNILKYGPTREQFPKPTKSTSRDIRSCYQQTLVAMRQRI